MVSSNGRTVKRSTRSTRSTRMTTRDVQLETGTRMSTRPKGQELTHTKRNDKTMSRMNRWGAIREVERSIRPAKTMLIMFLTLVIFFAAFGILYQNVLDFKNDSNLSQTEQLTGGQSVEIIRGERNTSTNTQILQQKAD